MLHEPAVDPSLRARSKTWRVGNAVPPLVAAPILAVLGVGELPAQVAT